MTYVASASLIYVLSVGAGGFEPPASCPKPEAARFLYQQKRSFSLVRANIRSHTGTFEFGRVPLVCYLGATSAPSTSPPLLEEGSRDT